MAWSQTVFTSYSGADSVVDALFDRFVILCDGVPLREVGKRSRVVCVEITLHRVADSKDAQRPDIGIEFCPASELYVCQHRNLQIAQSAFIQIRGVFKRFFPSALYPVKFGDDSEMIFLHISERESGHGAGFEGLVDRRVEEIARYVHSGSCADRELSGIMGLGIGMLRAEPYGCACGQCSDYGVA